MGIFWNRVSKPKLHTLQKAYREKEKSKTNYADKREEPDWHQGSLMILIVMVPMVMPIHCNGDIDDSDGTMSVLLTGFPHTVWQGYLKGRITWWCRWSYWWWLQMIIQCLYFWLSDFPHAILCSRITWWCRLQMETRNDIPMSVFLTDFPHTL